MKFSRRSLLRGVCGGAAVSLALPFLDYLLNDNGTALANGQPLPVRFGTWFWGLGMTTNPRRWVPSKIESDYDLGPELRFIEPHRKKITVFSGYDVKLVGEPSIPHQTGLWGLRTGQAPRKYNDAPLPTIDVLIADAIGQTTRFKSLEVAATGNPKDSYARRGPGQINVSEGTSLGLYARLFGDGFRDPNNSQFVPDPEVMVRKSVLSSVSEDRTRVLSQIGAADRARLDEYFTSLRQLEQQLSLQLEAPPPAEACKVPERPHKDAAGYEIGQVTENHKMMARLLAMAIACDQTRVFNMLYSDTGSMVRKSGDPNNHHFWTHEERIDPVLGYQPISTWFVERSMEAWATFVETLDGVREGAGTLLDNCMVLAHSDSAFAKSHSITGIPVMLAGSAGGRLRTGVHVAGNGEPVTRIGLTVQQVMGVRVDRWGVGAMEVSRPVSDVLA